MITTMNQDDNIENHVQPLWDGTNAGEFISDVEGDEYDKKEAVNDISNN